MRETRMELHWGRLIRCYVERQPNVDLMFRAAVASDPEVERIATVLHDQYKLDLVAPGHCTGEPEFAALKKIFGDHYLYAGAGTVIELSRAQVASSTSSGGR